MRTKKTAGPVAEERNAANHLREKLEDNRKKLQVIALEIGEKNEELGRLKAEIEQLGKQYNSGLFENDIN